MKQKINLQIKKKPTLQFGNDGICSACKSIKAKKTIDWNLREKELLEDL